ncbi:MAG TPA: hypothetical protein VJC16_05965, partial [Candidatus Nanoarchaeia archaeon]|nr:hypothetical protein [Candidatus Nanoarchaeia archaeon]
VADLTQKELSALLPPGLKFDAVIAEAFFNSPTKLDILRESAGAHESSNWLKINEQLDRSICQAVYSLLHDDGIYLVDRHDLLGFSVSDGTKILHEAGFELFRERSIVDTARDEHYVKMQIYKKQLKNRCNETG